MGRALSELVTSSLAGDPGLYAIPSNRLHGLERAMGARPVAAPGISSERALAMAEGATRLVYGEYWPDGARLRARLTVEDLQTGKVAVHGVAVSAGDVPAAATALARTLWSGAPATPAVSETALREYASALESTDLAAAETSLERAIAAAPDFTAAYRLLAQFKAQRQDRAGALAAIGRAQSRNAPPVDRARLALDAAELSGRRGARLAALTALSGLTPSDPMMWRALGEAAMAAHRFDAAYQAWRRATAIEPRDTASLNQMGYAAAHAGDLAGGMAALRRYQALRPADPNPLDSMGDVNLLSGKLTEAESFYLEASKKGPHFEFDGPLYKAAVARVMRGDVAGADQLATRYFEARAAVKDPALEYRRAEWLWLSGRHPEAMARLRAFVDEAAGGPLRELAARGSAELAVWKRTMGESDAAEFARKASALAGPASQAIAAVARFLTEPDAPPSEWAVRAERAFPDEAQAAVRSLSLAYALLLARQFQPAALTLKQFYDAGAEADDEGPPVLLAWAYVETGRYKEAAPLIQRNPIPSSLGSGAFLAFYFPRVFDLRARVAEKEGRAGDARLNRALFEKLGGAPTR
jgi:Flp pilus assembly protein TadD